MKPFLQRTSHTSQHTTLKKHWCLSFLITTPQRRWYYFYTAQVGTGLKDSSVVGSGLTLRLTPNPCSAHQEEMHSTFNSQRTVSQSQYTGKTR